MKRYVVFTALAALLAFSASAEEKPEAYQAFSITPVFSELITRDQDDRIYSGQIKSKEGLVDFQQTYGIEFDTAKVDFAKQMLVFGVTDTITTRAVHFLKQIKTGFFILDYADTGIKYKLQKPEEGKKYSYLQVFALDRIDGIPHVRVKNLVVNGLSKVYDNENHNKVPEDTARKFADPQH